MKHWFFLILLIALLPAFSSPARAEPPACEKNCLAPKAPLTPEEHKALIKQIEELKPLVEEAKREAQKTKQDFRRHSINVWIICAFVRVFKWKSCNEEFGLSPKEQSN